MAVDIHRRSDFYNVFWIAWPQALSMLVMTVQNMVDIFWIGKLGTESVAAVAISGNVIHVIFGLTGILHAGGIALMSRAMGAGDKEEASRVLAHSTILGIFMGLILLALGYIFAPSIVSFFQAGEEVSRLGVIYLRIMSWHLMLIFVAISPGVAFVAAGDTFTPLVINAIAIVANIVLDPICIFGPGQTVHIGGLSIEPGIFGWGIFGAGMATNFATILAILLFIVTVFMGRFPIKIPRPGRVKFEPEQFWRIIRIGVPFSIAHISRPLSTVILLRLITGFGTGAVAGFGIAMRWYSVNWIILAGIGMASATLVGQYLGAESKEGAARVSRRLIKATFIIQIFVTGLYCYFARDMIAIMDPNPATVGPGSDFMIWVVVGFLFSSPGGICAAAMNGAGDTKPGMIAGLVSNWAIKLPLAWALAMIPLLGLDGVWLAMFISLFAEGVIQMAWYRKGAWMKKVI